MDTAKKIMTTSVFELPRKLGVLQHVEYGSMQECTTKGCFYVGTLTAEGCRRGLCIKYRVRVHSKDRRKWEVKEWWERWNEEIGGCLRQAAADALWELAEKHVVEVWYEYRRHYEYMTLENCGVIIDGIKLGRPYCRTVDDCVKQILEDYRRAVERMKRTPMNAQEDDAAKFLREHPELEVFGPEWVKEWLLYAKERMIQIAEILRNHQKAKAVIEKVGIKENPYIIEIYVAPDEECVAVSTDVYCLSTEKIRKVPLDYVGLTAPRGLMAFAERKEFVRAV